MKKQADWWAASLALLLTAPVAFSLAFDPGVCNPEFSNGNFVALLGLGVEEVVGGAFCAYKALKFRRH